MGEMGFQFCCTTLMGFHCLKFDDSAVNMI